jgi:type II secretory pathway pseudopilin PulG
MLIVMGILIILMAVGLTAGRFAINRANDIAHQSAVTNIYNALQAYYADHREYPGAMAPKDLFASTSSPLYTYMDNGSFNGGSDATYYYFVDSNTTTGVQSFLICVSLGGIKDAQSTGFYCDGNGFGDSNVTVGGTNGSYIKNKTISSTATADATIYSAIKAVGSDTSNWYSSTQWTAPS